MFTLFLEKIFPIIIFFIIGYLLKIFKIIKKDDASILLKLVFYLFSPAVIILSVGSMHLEKTFIFYPITAICIHIIMYIIGLSATRFISLNTNEKKVFRGSLLVMNMTFILPFFIMFFGNENVYLLSMFDAGNLIMVSSLAYSLIVSKEKDTFMQKIILLLKSPLVISIIIGIIINIFNIKISLGIKTALENIADCTGTIIMLALGAYFTPAFKRLKLSFIIVLLKMFGMLFASIIFIKIFPIDAVGKQLLLLGAFSPIGNNVLTYVMISDGDIELASNIISLSIVISFIIIPFLLLMPVVA